MTQKFSYSENRTLTLFCGIKGLVRDGDALKREIEDLKPERIYICISQDEITGLTKFIEDPFEVNLSDYEILYGVALSRYGEVMTPPPIFIEPVSYARTSKVELIGLDFPEEEFSSIYTDNMGPRDLVMHSIRKKSMGRKRFPYDTPEEFVIEWDRLINRNKGMRKIEDLRLERMMSALMEDFRKSDSRKNMLIMEYEKCSQSREILLSEGFSPVS